MTIILFKQRNNNLWISIVLEYKMYDLLTKEKHKSPKLLYNYVRIIQEIILPVFSSN